MNDEWIIHIKVQHYILSFAPKDYERCIRETLTKALANPNAKHVHLEENIIGFRSSMQIHE